MLPKLTHLNAELAMMHSLARLGSARLGHNTLVHAKRAKADIMLKAI